MDREREIAAIRARLARLDVEKAELEVSLGQLLAIQEIKHSPPSAEDAPVTNASGPAAKIALFRSLFRGREDVFSQALGQSQNEQGWLRPQPVSMNGCLGFVESRK